MSDLLELQDIHLNYKTESTAVEVIRGVSLKINSNESVAIVGKSGSGKTSLIMLIAGLECPNSGKIIFEGEDISQYSEDRLADIRKRKIANKSTWTSVVVNFFLVIFQIVVGFFSKSTNTYVDTIIKNYRMLEKVYFTIK